MPNTKPALAVEGGLLLGQRPRPSGPYRNRLHPRVEKTTVTAAAAQQLKEAVRQLLAETADLGRQQALVAAVVVLLHRCAVADVAVRRCSTTPRRPAEGVDLRALVRLGAGTGPANGRRTRPLLGQPGRIIGVQIGTRRTRVVVVELSPPLARRARRAVGITLSSGAVWVAAVVNIAHSAAQVAKGPAGVPRSRPPPVHRNRVPSRAAPLDDGEGSSALRPAWCCPTRVPADRVLRNVVIQRVGPASVSPQGLWRVSAPPIPTPAAEHCQTATMSVD